MHFHGRREPDETEPEVTALRELHEETEGVLGEEVEHRIAAQLKQERRDRSFFYSEAGRRNSGIYLFFVETPFLTAIPQHFSQAVLERGSEAREGKHESLRWLPWSHVGSPQRVQRTKSTRKSVSSYQVVLWPFFQRMLSHRIAQRLVEKYLENGC